MRSLLIYLLESRILNWRFEDAYFTDNIGYSA